LLPDGTGIFQVHAGNYRNPDQLPPGAVLVVGAGTSGAQIAEELRLAGRQVYLSVGGHQRLPRRYRGHDFVWWWGKTGKGRTAVEERGPDLSPNLITGAYGGYTIDFRHLAAQGVVLLGRVRSARDGVLTVAPDLADSIRSGDAAYLAFCDEVDAYVDLHGLHVPQDPEARAIPPAGDGLPEPLLQLNLSAAGIAAIVWATGYGFDFSWIDIPVLDERGVPRHRHGVTDVVGLYFLGLEWLTRKNSARLVGVGEDAARLADHIAARAAGV
jgi:putative flavoprotein involved in K+ transport